MVMRKGEIWRRVSKLFSPDAKIKRAAMWVPSAR
jgi:hypothetical protein